MRGLITHRIELGDSLQRIAKKYGIDDWREIVEINQLDSPYIDSAHDEDVNYEDKKVAKLGEHILIPTSEAYSVANSSDKEEIEALAYGMDLDLYHYKTVDHDVKGHLEANQSDVDIVKGLDNLGQQLLSRLSVEKGSLFMHPEFGSRLSRFYGRNYTQENVNKIIFEVESCIRSDFRVKDIKDIDADVIDGQVIIRAKVIPIEPGKPFDFKYIL